jgi:hypothetical protein
MKQPRIINNRQAVVVDVDGVEHICEYSLNRPRQRGGVQTLNITPPPGFEVQESIAGLMVLVPVQIRSAATPFDDYPPQVY